MHMVTAGDSASVAKHNVYIETDGFPITIRNIRGESRVGHKQIANVTTSQPTSYPCASYVWLSLKSA